MTERFILLASCSYFLRNIGNNNNLLQELFSFLIRIVVHKNKAISGGYENSQSRNNFNDNNTSGKKNINETQLQNKSINAESEESTNIINQTILNSLNKDEMLTDIVKREINRDQNSIKNVKRKKENENKKDEEVNSNIKEG